MTFRFTPAEKSQERMGATYRLRYHSDYSFRSIDPLQFVPPKFLSPFTPLTIAGSEALQHVPLIRWQCSGVRIRVTLSDR